MPVSRHGKNLGRPGLAILLAVLSFVTTLLLVRTRSVGGATFEFVFAWGLDRGPAGGVHTAFIREQDQSAGIGLMLWQTAVTRTGDGAYHFVGGPLAGEKDLIGLGQPFGGLEVWIGGAFRFVAFPNMGLKPMWIMTAVPTDGVLGANDKPVASITPEGRVRLNASNGSIGVDSTLVLSPNKWYYLLLHGRNGIAQQQELYIHDGDTGDLLETVTFTMTVAGSFKNRAVKWGHGTRQDCSGLDYYLDDLFYARGDVNPGPIKVFPKRPVGTAFNNGVLTVGGATAHDSVSEFPTDGDGSFVKNDTAITVPHQIEFTLNGAAPPAGGTVFAVQSTVVARRATPASVSPAFGLKLGGIESLRAVSARDTYGVFTLVHTLNPATTLPWTPAEVDGIQGVIKDADTNQREFRITNAWWDVVYTLAAVILPPPPPPGATPTATLTATPGATPTGGITPATTATPTRTRTPKGGASPTLTPTPTATNIPTATPTATETPTVTPTATETATVTPQRPRHPPRPPRQPRQRR
jgi:hypothetical protein